MNSSKFDVSLNDSLRLRQLIVENPDLPLICFASEEAGGECFPYTQCTITNCTIEQLTLYKDYWLDEDTYTEEIISDLADDYRNLSDKDYYKMIDKKVKETEFIKAIVFYVN